MPIFAKFASRLVSPHIIIRDLKLPDTLEEGNKSSKKGGRSTDEKSVEEEEEEGLRAREA